MGQYKKRQKNQENTLVDHEERKERVWKGQINIKKEQEKRRGMVRREKKWKIQISLENKDKIKKISTKNYIKTKQNKAKIKTNNLDY